MNSPANSTDNAAHATADAINKVADKAQSLTEGVLKGAQSAVAATRDAATTSMDKAEERVEKWRSQAEPAVADLTAKAQAMAERSINYCAETGAQMREQMDKCTEAATNRYVAEQPGKAIAIAAATGAALTLATLALLRKRGD